MKKRLTFLALSIFLSQLIIAQNINWATNLTNEKAVVSTVICIDGNDNLYGTGTFSGNISWESVSLTASSMVTDGFVVKFGKDSKTPVWAKGIQGSGSNKVTANNIATDSEGNIYVVGEFEGSVTIGQTTLDSDYADIYLFKLSSNGDVLAAKSFGYGAAPGIAAVSVDNNDNVYITGNFEDVITFGTDDDVIENEGNNAYLAKFDKDLNYLWASYAVGADAFTAGKRIAADNTGVYLIGSLVGSITFSGYSTAVASRDGATTNSFVAKFASNDGACVWAKGYGGTGNKNGSTTDIFNDVKVRNGIVSLIGDIRSIEATVDGISTVFKHNFESPTNPNILLLFLNTDGEYHSHHVFGDATANNGASGYALDVDNAGKAYGGGECSGVTNFGAHAPAGKGGGDMCFFKIDIDTKLVDMAYRFGADETESLRSIASNKNGSIVYMHGHFRKRSGTRTGNPNMEITGAGTEYKLTFGGANAQADNPFWARYDFEGSSVNIIQNDLNDNIYYNSANKSLEINSDENIESIRIMDISGKLIYANTGKNIESSISLAQLQAGLYIASVKTKSDLVSKKFIVK